MRFSKSSGKKVDFATGMDELQERQWDILCSLSGEKVASLFIDFYGGQILNDEFLGHLEAEGLVDLD